MINKIIMDTLWTLYKMEASNKDCIDISQQTATPEFMDGLDFLEDLGVVELDIGDDPNVVKESFVIHRTRVKSLLKLLRSWEAEDKDTKE